MILTNVLFCHCRTKPLQLWCRLKIMEEVGFFSQFLSWHIILVFILICNANDIPRRYYIDLSIFGFSTAGEMDIANGVSVPVEKQHENTSRSSSSSSSSSSDSGSSSSGIVFPTRIRYFPFSVFSVCSHCVVR